MIAYVFGKIHMLSMTGGSSLDHRNNRAGTDRLTMPKTPNFETRHRLRPNTSVSQTQREEMEVEDAKK